MVTENEKNPLPVKKKIIKYAKFACVGVAAIGIATTAYVAGLQTLYGIRASDIASTAWNHFIEPITRYRHFGHTSYLDGVLFGMEIIGLNVIGKSAYQKINSLFHPKKEMQFQPNRKNGSPNFEKNQNFTNEFNPGKYQNKKKKNFGGQYPDKPVSPNENFVNASTVNSESQASVNQEPSVNTPSKALDTLAQIRKKREEAQSTNSLKI